MTYWVMNDRTHTFKQSIESSSAFPPNISASWQKMLNDTKQEMPTLQKHLERENLHRINRAWKYLKTWQRGWIFVRAMLWSLPSAGDILEWNRRRVLLWATRQIYKAHWL